MGTREWVLTAAVIIVPLVIAVIVTAWSLEQARYRPKRRNSRPSAALAEEPPDRSSERAGGDRVLASPERRGGEPPDKKS